MHRAECWWVANGAVINLAPDLWNGIIAQVPFVDVVNTISESIPLTINGSMNGVIRRIGCLYLYEELCTI
jgi:hypothetical protein